MSDLDKINAKLDWLETRVGLDGKTAIAALRIALEKLDSLPDKIEMMLQNECVCGSIQGEHGCQFCSASIELDREIRDHSTIAEKLEIKP